jgi:DNA-binding transcriptional regulator YhcF (GntR family)
MSPKTGPEDFSFDFVPSQADGRPLYQQIMERIRQYIAVGNWSQGKKLPSIRELAAAAEVSVITVKRAYRELEIEGVLVTRQGQGTWVTDQEDDVQARREELERAAAQIVALAEAADVSHDELCGLLARHQSVRGGHK